MSEENKPGATGQFPKGKLNDEDEGELKLGVTVHDNTLIIHFGTPVTWLGLPKEDAQAFIEALQKHVNILK